MVSKETTNSPQRKRRNFIVKRQRQCYCREFGDVTYRDVTFIRRYVNDRGRMDSAQRTGNCAKCHRRLTKAVQRARFLALLPYAADHIRITAVLSDETSPDSTADTNGADDEAENSLEQNAESEPLPETKN